MSQSVDQWTKYWKSDYSQSNYCTNYGAHIYSLEARSVVDALAAASFPEGMSILTLGVGLGAVELEVLARGTFPKGTTLFGVDLVHPVLSQFKQEIDRLKSKTTIIPVLGDSYHLPFADNTFDLLMSFGRACVASYRGVVPEVVRVTKPGGTVIMDFINHISLYDVWDWRNWRRYLKFKKILSEDPKYTHFGPIGIAETYAEFGLSLRALNYLGCVVPIGNAFSKEVYESLERYWPLKRVFSRVLLGTFSNMKPQDEN